MFEGTTSPHFSFNKNTSLSTVNMLSTVPANDDFRRELTDLNRLPKNTRMVRTGKNSYLATSLPAINLAGKTDTMVGLLNCVKSPLKSHVEG